MFSVLSGFAVARVAVIGVGLRGESGGIGPVGVTLCSLCFVYSTVAERVDTSGEYMACRLTL